MSSAKIFLRATALASFAVAATLPLAAATASYVVPIDTNTNGVIESSEIQSVLNTAKGVVFLPASNTYSLNATLTITSKNGVSLVGEGVTTVLPIVGNIEGVVISAGTGCAVRHVKFVGGVGHAQNAIRISGGNEHAVQGVTFQATYRAIQLVDGIGPLLTDVTMTGLTGDYGIKIDGSGGTAKVDAAQLHNITGSSSGTNIEWLLFGRADGIEVQTASLSGSKRGLRAYGATGPKYVYTNNVTISSPANEGVLFESGADVLVNDTTITNSGGTGFGFGSSFVGGAVLTDLTISSAAGHGVSIEGGRDIGILEPVITATGSALTAGTGAGIKIATACSYVSVTDGSVKGGQYGILYTGTTTQSDNQNVKMKNVTLTTNTVPSSPGNLEGPPASTIIIDNTDTTRVTLTGAWTAVTTNPGYYGANYLHDGNTGTGKSARFTPTLVAGNYEVFARWSANVNRANNTPIDVIHAGGTSTFSVNQELNNGTWVSLGVFTFNAGTGGSVLIRNAGANGYVIADAVQFIPQ
ncbi:golvesin C-terminal-like domain-containing protein [Oleiharenicola lentus]|uniref:golvesin C-terminal-like domain-containing protein n=1 Tax=Oleiharenicola lentus TaxID=2508720 RepID=UPI003F66678B